MSKFFPEVIRQVGIVERAVVRNGNPTRGSAIVARCTILFQVTQAS